MVFLQLLKYECGKTLRNRKFLVLWCLLVVLQVFLAAREESLMSPYQPGSEEYEAVYAILQREESPAKALEVLNALIEEMEAESYSTSIATMVTGGEDTKIQGTEDQSKTVSQAGEQIRSLFPENHYLARRFLEKIRGEVSAVAGREKMVASAVENARILGNLSMLQSQTGSRQGNIEKTGRDFEKAPQVMITQVWPERGLAMCFQNPLADVFVLLLLFAALHLMVAEGYQNGMETLVLSTRCGRGQVSAARATALALVTGIVWLVFFAAQAATSRFFYSWGDLSRPVQSVSSYVKCLFPLSVGQLLFLCFTWKWLVYVLCGLLALGLMKLWQRELLAYGFLAGLWGVGFLLWTSIADNSAFAMWKYSNLYVLLRPDLIWGSYRNIELVDGYGVITGVRDLIVEALRYFSLPVPAAFLRQLPAGGSIWISGWNYALAILAFLLAFCVGLLYLLRDRLVQMEKSISIVRKRKGPSIGNSLLGGELKKGYVVQKAALFFGLLICFQWQGYGNENLYHGNEEVFYQQYMNRWERELTGPDALLKDAMEEEWEEVTKGLRNESETYGRDVALVLMNSLQRAEERYNKQLDTLTKKGGKLLYFYEGQYRYLVDSPDRDIQNGAQALLLIILLSAMLAGLEQKSGMRVMIRSTGKGEKWYAALKLCLVVSYVFLAELLFYSPDILLTCQTYDLSSSLPAAVQSLPSLAAFPLPMSILQYLILLYVWRFLVLSAAGALTLWLVEVLKNGTVAALFAVILLWLPCLLYYLGLKDMAGFGILPFLGGNRWFMGW